jgi:large subunit ribosomal protein L19e
MKLQKRKRIAALLLKTSQKNVVFDNDELNSIKESITKADIRKLIGSGTITIKAKNGPSRVRARKNKLQKVKGRRTGQGSRKGRATARSEKKREWINRIRKQRSLLRTLKENKKIDNDVYRELYRKAKGGFFRNIRHLKMYLNDLIKKQEK